MAAKINLDAMIKRSDFAIESSSIDSGENIKTLGVEQLTDQSMVMKSLRKPDFQRETNHWSSTQLLTFLKSYVDRELIPSVILWQSKSYIFVIDGAHRLSALKAWINDDYGDGATSQMYYGHEIPTAQKKIAKHVRALINDQIGTFAYLSSASGETEGFAEIVKERSSTIASRTFSLQWVNGNAEKAETSFFKINTQGTPLHKTEERLLRNRRMPIAITARAIVRAGTGNKYWSQFDDDTRHDIEQSSRELHGLLFTPEVAEPIKTLDLPLGGSSSLLDALNLLMDFIDIACDSSNIHNTIDEDGKSSVATLNRCLKVVKRITGNDAGSMGLHPAVYFYNQRGKHNQHLFLAIVSVFASRIRSNDKDFFKKYTVARGPFEEFLIANKFLISQAIVNIRSTSRVSRLVVLFESLIERFSKGELVSTKDVLSILRLQGELITREVGTSPSFSKETKSEIFLKNSLDSAIKCPICKGYIDPNKSLSYDHIQRISDGGDGRQDNGQMTHPYCNSAIKG